MSPTGVPTVLVVEDDSVQREAMATVLEQLGYCAETASSGQSALGYLLGHPKPPALLVLDLNLPGLTGWDLLGMMSFHPRLRGLPVVVTSAEPLATETLERGQVAACLPKPVMVRSLQRLLNELAPLPASAASSN